MKLIGVDNYLQDPKNREAVLALFGRIKEGLRYVLKRHHIDGIPLSKIAVECGLPEHRVSTTYTNAMKLVTDILKKEGGMQQQKKEDPMAASKLFKDAAPEGTGSREGEKEAVDAPKRKYTRRQQGARAEFSLPLPQEVELVVRVKVVVEVVQQ